MKKLQEWDDCERSVRERHARAETAKGMEIYFLTECSTKAGQLGTSFQKLLKMERKQIHWKKESFLEEIQEGNVHSRFNIAFNTHRLKKNKEISKQKNTALKQWKHICYPGQIFSQHHFYWLFACLLQFMLTVSLRRDRAVLYLRQNSQSSGDLNDR